jgi:hypothetical protein
MMVMFRYLVRIRLMAVSALALGIVLMLPATGSAQNIGSATIEGTVSDDTGAVLPGVAVTCSSPALQVPSVTTITDAEGRYRFLDLRLGVYSLRYELQGFQPLLREGLQLRADFNARVNVALKVGDMSETVTVTAAGSVVDLVTTRGGRNVPSTLIASALPASKNVADLVYMTPGLIPQANAGENPAALGQNTRARWTTYGVNSDNTNSTLMIDGLPTQVNTPIPNAAATDEVDVKTFGLGAEVKEPGAVINLIIKAGGNAFHGEYFDEYMRQPSGNLDATLQARGLRVGQDLQYFNDVHGDLGGRLVRDKLWFYGSARDRRNQTTQPGLVANAGPDGKYLTGDEPAALPKGDANNYIGKVSYQMTPHYQFIGLANKDRSYSDIDLQTTPFGASATDFSHIPLERTNTSDWKFLFLKGEVRGTPRNNLVFDVNFGRSHYTIDWGVQPQAVNIPSAYNRNTLLLTGSANPHQSVSWQYNATADITFIPSTFGGGHHEFKFGYSAQIRQISSVTYSNPAGDYSLLFDTVGGVPNQAVQIEVQNAPVVPTHWDNYYSVYFGDRVRLGSRFTATWGLRVDHSHSFVPEQARVAGAFAPATTFPRVEVGTWNKLAPRAALAWDTTGTGRTVAKFTYGWFNIGSDLAATYNGNARYTTTYKWHDLNNNGNYDPGEVNLSTSSTDFVSTTNIANTILNPSLQLGHEQEATASLEHELGANVSVRGLYLYKRLSDLFTSTNVLRPYSAYTIPITRKDPGADGILGTADDGGPVTLYDYTPAFLGGTFVGNENLNRPGSRDDFYQAVEVALNRRLANKWSALASYTATKYHQWLVGISQSPNDDPFALDANWRWNLKLNGNYSLPRDVIIGAIVDVESGFLGQRSYVFRPTDASGPPLTQLTSVTMRLEPFGSEHESALPVLNLRVGKKFVLHKSSFQLNLDVLNVANSSGIKGATYVSGPGFGTVTSIQGPRLLRLGMSFNF